MGHFENLPSPESMGRQLEAEHKKERNNERARIRYRIRAIERKLDEAKEAVNEINESERGAGKGFRMVRVKGEEVESQGAKADEEVLELEERIRALEGEKKALEEALTTTTVGRTPSEGHPERPEEDAVRGEDPSQRERTEEPTGDSAASAAAGGVSETARSPEASGTVGSAQTFEELYTAIKGLPGMPEGFADFPDMDKRSGLFGAAGFQWLIERIRRGEDKLSSLPTEYSGIRAKVEELMAKGRDESEPPSTPPSPQTPQETPTAEQEQPQTPSEPMPEPPSGAPHESERQPPPEPSGHEPARTVEAPKSEGPERTSWGEEGGVENEWIPTPEAVDFLQKSEKGLPFSMTQNMKRILAENGIPLDPDMAPQDAILMLRWKAEVGSLSEDDIELIRSFEKIDSLEESEAAYRKALAERKRTSKEGKQRGSAT